MKAKKKQVVVPFPVRDDAITQLASSVQLLQALKIDTITEARIFCAAARSSGATIGDITKELGVPFSTSSRVAFSLLERGLLRFEPHPTDRRKKIISANLEKLA